MTDTHTLTRHRDIKAWVAERQGMPALRRTPNRFGEMESRLALRFGTPRPPRAGNAPPVDQGESPCSWTAWLAELDRQQLALRVSADDETAYELIERKTLN